MGQGFAQFANVRWTAGWEMPVTAGPAPSVCTIRTVPHLDHLEQHGNLTLIDEGNGSLVLRDCLLETPHLNEDQTWSLPILDRRWRNRFGEIDGHYNIKRPDKTFIREKSPQELAALCLEAMGEQRGNWDVGRLPNFARPEVEWDNDNPADALDEIVTQLGCTLTLDYFQDRYVVWPIGQGVDLPDGPTASRAAGLAATAKPDEIKALSAHIMYQVRFACEAAGLDTDGKWKRLEDLSYKPLDDDDPEEFNNIAEDDMYITPEGEQLKTIDLAKETCYKTYRIIGIAKSGATVQHSTATASAKLPVDGWSPESLKGNDSEPMSFQDIKLLDHQALQYLDEEDAPGEAGHFRKVDRPPAVYARMFDGENATTPKWPTRYHGSVSVDTTLGLVKLGEPAYLIVREGSAAKAVPAEVYIDIAFHAGRDGHLVRKVKKLETGERNNSGARVLKHEDVEVRVIQAYVSPPVGSTAFKVELQSTTTRPDDWDQQLQYYIDAVLPEYDSLPSYTRHYKKLMAIVPDGRIRQITWSGGGGDSPSTRVSLNTEHDNYTPTIEDDRRRAATDKAVKDRQNARVTRKREARV